MSTVWLVVAIHAGLFAVGFGLAGVLQFQDFEKGERLGVAGMDSIGIVSVVAAAGAVFENWEKSAVGRRLVYAGLISLAAMVGALLLRQAA